MTRYRPINPSGNTPTGRNAESGALGFSEAHGRTARGGGRVTYPTGEGSVNVWIEDDRQRKTLVLPTDAGWVEFGLEGSTVTGRPFARHDGNYVGDLGSQTPVTLDTGDEVWSFHSGKAVSSRRETHDIGYDPDRSRITGATKFGDMFFFVTTDSGSPTVTLDTVFTDGHTSSASFDVQAVAYSAIGKDSHYHLELSDFRMAWGDSSVIDLVLKTTSFEFGQPDSGVTNAPAWVGSPTFRIDTVSGTCTLHHDTAALYESSSTSAGTPPASRSVTLDSSQLRVVDTYTTAAILGGDLAGPKITGFKKTAGQTISVPGGFAYTSSTTLAENSASSSPIYKYHAHCRDTLDDSRLLTLRINGKPASDFATFSYHRVYNTAVSAVETETTHGGCHVYGFDAGAGENNRKIVYLDQYAGATPVASIPTTALATTSTSHAEYAKVADSAFWRMDDTRADTDTSATTSELKVYTHYLTLSADHLTVTATRL